MYSITVADNWSLSVSQSQCYNVELKNTSCEFKWNWY